MKVYVCTNMRFGADTPSCAMRGSKKTCGALKDELARRGKSYLIEEIKCLGNCSDGPAIRIAPGGEFFFDAKPTKVEEIADWVIQEMEKG